MTRPGYYIAPSKGARESVGPSIVITAETSRIEDTCRLCRRPMLMPPWVTECLRCQQTGRPVSGARIARCYL